MLQSQMVNDAVVSLVTGAPKTPTRKMATTTMRKGRVREGKERDGRRGRRRSDGGRA